MTNTIFKTLILGGAAAFALSSISGCATISEDACLAGSWQDEGFKDGQDGTARSRFAKIAETCGKYGVVPDRTAYMSGYDFGLQRYCIYDIGFRRGEGGSSPNAECVAGQYDDYLAGHADGYVNYEINSEYDGLIDRYDETVTALVEVRRRLADEEMSADERKRLRKKEIRLEDRKDDLRIDIRAFERLHDFPRRDIS